MTKPIKLSLLLVITLLFIVGYGSKVRNVRTYDENLEAEE